MTEVVTVVGIIKFFGLCLLTIFLFLLLIFFTGVAVTWLFSKSEEIMDKIGRK